VDYAFLGRGDQGSSLFNIEYNRNLYGNLFFRGKAGYGIAANTGIYSDYDEIYINYENYSGPNDYLRSFFDAEIGLEFAFLNSDFNSLSIFSGLCYMDDSGPLSGVSRSWLDPEINAIRTVSYSTHNNTHGFGGVIGLRCLINLSGNLSLDMSASRVIVEHSGSLNGGIGLGLGF
jgi:hypothetical protein